MTDEELLRQARDHIDLHGPFPSATTRPELAARIDARLSQPAAPVAPEGMVMVPRKMTPEQFRAAREAGEEWIRVDDPDGRSREEVVWDAMVRAAEQGS